MPAENPTYPLLAFQSALALLGLLLAYFMFQALLGHRLGKNGGWLALGVSGIAFGLATSAWYLAEYAAPPLTGNPLTSSIQWEWVAVTGSPLTLDLSLNLSWLHRTMLPIVTGVTFLVHLFSLSYMAGDRFNHRYWAYLALFSFAMCGVVLAGNFLMVFLFWELMGLASYFLIGFWFQKEIPARASQKAFVVNRIGDMGFVVALMAMFATYGTFDATEILAHPAVGNGATNLNTVISVGLLLAVMGKSAQFPLQVWLPDAMAGPTPVSSLIHAATMVAAGVFLLIQSAIFFSTEIMELITLVGCATALMAAISALTQTDIKRVLAYSTISQLGFMVAGIGMGAFNSAFFHLVTHAFFKCGLFLTAGAVIHALHHAQNATGIGYDAQDLRWMGGLRKKMPLTFVTYVIFAAALAGLPFTSGFLSKDGILLQAIELAQSQGGLAWLAPGSLMLASLFTAVYITRHGVLIFGGQFRAARRPEFRDIGDHVRRTDWKMAVALVVLATLSLGVVYSPTHPFHAKLGQSLDNISLGYHAAEWWPIVFSGIAMAGILFSAWQYRRGPAVGRIRGVLYQFSFQHFFLDEFYREVIARNWLRLARLLGRFDVGVVDGLVNLIAAGVVRNEHRPSLSLGSTWVERNVVDRFVNGVANAALRLGQRLRSLQAGKLQLYLAYTLLAVLLLLLGLFYFAGQ